MEESPVQLRELPFGEHYAPAVMLTESRVPGSPSIRGRLSFAEPHQDGQCNRRATPWSSLPRSGRPGEPPARGRAVDTGRIERGLATRLMLWLVLHVCCTRCHEAAGRPWNKAQQSTEAPEIAGLQRSGPATKVASDHYTSGSVVTHGTK